MLEILDSPKHLVAMRLSGDLTADDITRANKAADDALKESDRISFFIEVDPSMKPTLEGVVKDLIESVKQAGKLSKYHRAALVTDRGWLAAMARVEGLLFASIDVRVFGPEDRNKAFAWASEAIEPTASPHEPEPSLHLIQSTSENVFAYEISGRLREKDIKNAVRELKPYIERDGKFNVLARMKSFNGFDLLSVFDDDLIRLKIKAPSKIEKYAVVGPKPWLRNLLELVNPLVRTDVKVFDADEESAAWAWVGAEQALLPE